MNALFISPEATDVLAKAVRYVRPHLEGATNVSERVQILWAAVIAARDLGASNVIEVEFMRLALDVGLGRGLGRHSDETLRHVIRWGIVDRNPFQ